MRALPATNIFISIVYLDIREIWPGEFMGAGDPLYDRLEWNSIYHRVSYAQSNGAYSYSVDKLLSMSWHLFLAGAWPPKQMATGPLVVKGEGRYWGVISEYLLHLCQVLHARYTFWVIGLQAWKRPTNWKRIINLVGENFISLLAS